MSLQNNNKYKIIFNEVPKDTFFTQSWLNEKGISNQLTYKYINNELIKRIHRGLYLRFSDSGSWKGFVYTLQTINELPVHLSSLSALSVHGHSHYIPLKEQVVWISKHTSKNIDLPHWYNKIEIENYVFKFDKTNLFKTGFTKYINEFDCGDYMIKVSSRERAFFEMLKMVPQKVSFDNAYHIAEGLLDLDIHILRDLVGSCTSKKTIRLFAYICESLNLPWFKDLDINFNRFVKGILVIQKGGEYIPKHKLFVPRR